MEAFLNDTLPQLLTIGGTIYIVGEVIGLIVSIFVVGFAIKTICKSYHNISNRRHF